MTNNNQIITCKVLSCKFNNNLSNQCKLNEIEINCNCANDKCNCKEKTICNNYQERK